MNGGSFMLLMRKQKKLYKPVHLVSLTWN